MQQAKQELDKPQKNPLIWGAVMVVVLIALVVIFTRRGQEAPDFSLDNPQPQSVVKEGEIERTLLVPPGMRARELVDQYRQQGKPYPFEEIMAKASAFSGEGSLADAHLLFFFAAREGYVDAMIVMAEMSDPTMFQSENNLLDQAEPIQAYKWYKAALAAGFEPARSRLDNLEQWARAESQYGNSQAAQLLLNFN